ncbi:MAG: hypothetical protein M0Z31_11795 [Clostridia bacterium]|nr:hypothetical protein [Clostridia bacterium]
MRMNTNEFLKKAMMNEQELVRDYQNFADEEKNRNHDDVAKLFYHWAEQDALRSNTIKDLLDKYGEDSTHKSN